MSKIKVTQMLEVYEVDDTEVPLGKKTEIGLDSHWNLNSRVVLKIGGHSYTVIGRALIMATQNAMNVGII